MSTLRSLCCSCNAQPPSPDAALPLCESCLDELETASSASSASEWYRSSYCYPNCVLEVHGDKTSKALGSLLFPQPNEVSSSPPTHLAAEAAIALLMKSSSAPLLILLGAGCSASYGIAPGYGVKPVVEGESVNERYWGVYEQASRFLKTVSDEGKSADSPSFYQRLSCFVAERCRSRDSGDVCIATSNIDGLCPLLLGEGNTEVLGKRTKRSDGGKRLLELHGSVLRLQCTRRGRKRCAEHLIAAPLAVSAATPGDASPKHRLGVCTCRAPLRFNVTSFGDWPHDVIGTQSVQSTLREWVAAQESQPLLQILVIGCSDHLHSMIHEARSCKYMRSQLSPPLLTEVFCVNPEPAAAQAVVDCYSVTCSSEDLFREAF